MKLRCKVCKGTGLEKNPNYECCKFDDNNWDKMKERKGCGTWCPAYKLCKVGKKQDCHNCNGDKYRIIDDDRWELVK